MHKGVFELTPRTPPAGPRPQPGLGLVLRRATLFQFRRPRRRPIRLRPVLPDAHAIHPQSEIHGDARGYEALRGRVPRV